MFVEMVGNTPFNKKDIETRTVLGELSKEKLKAPADPTESKWIKDIQRQMDQLQTTLKRHELNPNFTNLDMDLGEKESLPLKYQFPSMKKYSGTDDPHLHSK